MEVKNKAEEKLAMMEKGGLVEEEKVVLTEVKEREAERDHGGGGVSDLWRRDCNCLKVITCRLRSNM